MWVGGWRGGSLGDTPPSDDVIPSLAQVHLLGRGPGLLSFRSGSLTCCDALLATFGCLHYKSRLRFLPLYTATVVRCVVSPATTALRLFPRCRASTGGGGSPHTRHTGVRIRSYAACVRSPGKACIAVGLLDSCTTPPTLASRRVQ